VKAVVAPNRAHTYTLPHWKEVKVSGAVRLRVLLLSPEVAGEPTDR
jgi:hypothetical protein